MRGCSSLFPRPTGEEGQENLFPRLRGKIEMGAPPAVIDGGRDERRTGKLSAAARGILLPVADI